MGLKVQDLEVKTVMIDYKQNINCFSKDQTLIQPVVATEKPKFLAVLTFKKQRQAASLKISLKRKYLFSL
ncbi:unnamed protein product [Hermetia illucens]|uniref:Uncharacterized protein n=1 Tax=Hermetia illucens TaxID=343691 RepID=A0A7R8USX4_HERIL|nr:unnamed protein product [Hermetia illucens]